MRPIATGPLITSCAVGTEKRERQKTNRQARLAAAAEAADKAKQRQRLTMYGILAAVVVGAILLFAVVLKDDDDDSDVAAETTTTLVTDSTTTVATSPCPAEDGSETRTTSFAAAPSMCIDPTATYTAVVATSAGEFTVELDAAAAPLTVNNFVTLARYHYYDGVSFHRIIPGFVVQGGDAVGNPPGTGGPGYQIADELPTEGPPYYEVGSLAMANSGPNTNGSQFFVVTGEQGASLPASYSLFGQVTEGMDVVAAIEATGTESGTPTEETVIESVTVTEA